MKTLQNKTTEIPFPTGEKEKKRNYTYADLISTVCDKMPTGGFTTSVMRGRIKIQEKCAEAKETIELEDADATAVKILVKDMTWAVKHKDLLDFEDDVNKAFK